MILKSLGIAIELCDISAPGMEVMILVEQDRKHDWFLNNQEQRDFMRANAVKKEGQRNVLPPQVFNGEKYCGVRFGLSALGVLLIYRVVKGGLQKNCLSVTEGG